MMYKFYVRCFKPSFFRINPTKWIQCTARTLRGAKRKSVELYGNDKENLIMIACYSEFTKSLNIIAERYLGKWQGDFKEFKIVGKPLPYPDDDEYYDTTP